MPKRKPAPKPEASSLPPGIRLLHTLEGHTDAVLSVAVTPDGRQAVTGSYDETVRVRDLASGACLRTLEGHTGGVLSVAVTPDGKHLVSGSDDATARVWAVDWRVLWGAARSGPVSYRNAKVVLVGDTGVGKSGLAGVLAGGKFRRTESTHGRRVWSMDRRTRKGPAGTPSPSAGTAGTLAGSGGTPSLGPRPPLRARQTQEILLWDLAGQPGYRLVHQLNIDQAAVALVLIDARSETDPLGAAEYWARAVRQARSSLPVVRFLVGARSDRGGLAVSREAIDRFCADFGFQQFFVTSAKTGEGVADLREAIRDAIDWSKLTEVVSDQLFADVKRFLQTEKERGDAVLLLTLADLHARYTASLAAPAQSALVGRDSSPDAVPSAGAHPLVGRSASSDTLVGGASAPTPLPSPDAFRTCVARLEAAGLIEVLDPDRGTGGSPVTPTYVLMQPEYIDAYASAIILTARDDPRGIGHILESRVLACDLRMAEDDRVPADQRDIESILLPHTVQRLLDHDIALRERLDEGDYLVFPSQYTRTAPFPRLNAPGVAFDFEGPVPAIFTTLVVRLAHHRDFADRDFYKDAACYQAKTGGRCIVVLDEPSPGRGRLTAYFENTPSLDEQRAFLAFIHRHLEARANAGSVAQQRVYYCPACGRPWDGELVNRRLQRGEAEITCSDCDTTSPLHDVLLFTPSALADALQIDSDAETARRRDVAAARVRTKERLGQYDVFLSYNAADRERAVVLAELLRSLGFLPWLDVWEIIPGHRWQDALEEAITQVRSAAVLVGPDGLGPWQDREMRAFLEEFVQRDCPVMPVLLPGLPDAPKLPVFLRGHQWVDLRKLTDKNVAPLANLVAGILGKRPRELPAEDLKQLVTNVPAAVSEPEAPGLSEEVTIAVGRPDVGEEAVDAVRLQLARLLDIPARTLEVVETKPGSVQITFKFTAAADAARFFWMVSRSDREAEEFLQRWAIDPDSIPKPPEPSPPPAREPEACEPEYAPRDLPKADFKEWLGAKEVGTLAVTFTDIVGSTPLCRELGDEKWSQRLSAHLSRTIPLIRDHKGLFVKNLGDGALCLFHNAGDAVAFARTLAGNTGDPLIRLRIGIHVGQVKVRAGDPIGHHVNLAARVTERAENGGIIISARAKEDLDDHRESRHANLAWLLLPAQQLPGIPDPLDLYLLA
ncbi:MAG: TIR domain-containing protein [Armatimonadetes bacterium]|nr:TIR domain-containing protein [Armatimonadota bacterium]